MNENGIALLGTVALLGIVVEFVIERILGKSVQGTTMWYISAVLGICLGMLFAFGLHLTLLQASGMVQAEEAEDWADYLVTGLIIGCGSGLVHLIQDKYLVRK